MESKTTFSAARGRDLVFGILAGLGGLTHGSSEVLQGSVKPDRIIIHSWTQGPIATDLADEPGVPAEAIRPWSAPAATLDTWIEQRKGRMLEVEA